MCTIDLAASFASLVHADVPENACNDSVNVIDALLGKPDAKGRASLIQQDNGKSGNYGFRVGKWKLQRSDSKKASNVELRLQRRDVPRFQLFDLDKDPEERENLIDQYPEIAARLIQELEALIQ